MRLFCFALSYFLTTAYSFDDVCPAWLVQDALPAFVSATDLHNVYDGISMLKWRLSDVLAGAFCQARHVIAPHPRINFGSTETTVFEELFDLAWLSERLHAAFGYGLVSDTCVDRFPVEATIDTHEMCIKNTSKPFTILSWRNAAKHKIESSSEAELKRVLIREMKPAAALRRYIAELLETSLSQPFVCLHLRTENDFKQYQQARAPGYYTAEEIAAKILSTRKAPGSLLREIRTIYISGDHNNITALDQVFKPLFTTVVTKFALRGIDKYPYMKMALIDKEVCQAAAVFIGNNHSSWSEFVAFFRMLTNRTMLNYQYNAVSSADNLTAPLTSFCAGAHHMMHIFKQPCTYYRRI